MSLDITSLQDVYILEFLESLDCARSLTVAILYKHKEFRQIVELSINPDDFVDVGRFRDALAATSFLSKNKFLETGISKETVAMEKFLEAEVACKETNERVLSNSLCSLTQAVIMTAARKIQNILGRIDAEEFVDSCNWGPGATVKLPRRRASAPEKFRSENGITAGAYGFVKDWFHVAYPLWGDVIFEIQSGNKVVTVPKNAKTDRVIAIEPGINLWFQKGIGSIIRNRLRKNGIDLNSQAINGNLARVASRYGHLATVDFSSASDTISTEVVRLLLPHDWYCLLDNFRSIRGTLPDKTEISYQKFSSMGNGYTFELESLIFYAIAISICEIMKESGSISVFGDDVIIPSGAFDNYSIVCAELGFTVNKKKSFSSGYFRESCGSYYYNGQNVKPIFQKEPFDGQSSLIKCANSLRNFAHSRNSYGCDRDFAACWRTLAKYLEGLRTPRIPPGFGDLGLIVSDDEFQASDYKSARNGYEGYYFRVIATLSVQSFENRRGYLLSRLWSIGWSRWDLYGLNPAEPSIANSVVLPGRVKPSLTRMLVPRWDDIGPWV